MSVDGHGFRTWSRLTRAQLRYFPRALGLVWACCPGLVVAWIVLLVAQGIIPVGIVYLIRSLVNFVLGAVRGGGSWADVEPVLATAGLLAGVLLLVEALKSVGNWVRSAQAECVQDHIADLIHQKSAAADLAFYETPEFYDHLHRARAEAAYRPIALLASIGSVVQNGVTLAGMTAVLIPFGLWLPLALLASTLPALWAVIGHAQRQRELQLRSTADERRTWYYDWLLTSAEAAAEMRLFDAGGHFRSASRSLRARLRRERLALKKRQIAYELGAAAIALLAAGSALAYILWRALRGFVTLGDVALFYQAFSQGQLLMRSLLENTGQIYANGLFLENLFAFLDLQPGVVNPERPVAAAGLLKFGICFDRVTFAYPGARTALHDFTLLIPAGQIAAIVGPNGAGKSTLIKLLCRFYDPDCGRIEMDGIDIRDFNVDELRRQIGVLFQMPVHYNATVRQNIVLGNLSGNAGNDDIEAAAAGAGAEEFIAKLPRRYDHLLGRWFETGTELSVGEWQKVALARAFLRSAPLMLLDEPTSAMDSWAEAAWLDRFQQLAEGRTAVIITHRLTTAMRADIIHVMTEGTIQESGTHDQLVAGHGWYAEAWARQMEVSV